MNSFTFLPIARRADRSTIGVRNVVSMTSHNEIPSMPMWKLTPIDGIHDFTASNW